VSVASAASISSLADSLAAEPSGAHIQLQGRPGGAPAPALSLPRCLAPKSTGGGLGCALSPFGGPAARWGVSPDFQLCRQWTTAEP